MKIKLENIGRIKNAEVEINTITVIAGENSSGKSTVGKALFSIFNALRNSDERFKKEKRDIAFSFLSRSTQGGELVELMDQILGTDNKDEAEAGVSHLIEQSTYFSEDVKQTFKEMVLDGIKIARNLSEKKLFFKIVERCLNNEFNQQISNLYNDQGKSSIDLILNDQTISIKIQNNSVEQIDHSQWLQQAFYIDTPLVLDDLSNTYKNDSMDYDLDHRELLKRNLSNLQGSVSNELIGAQKLNSVIEILDRVCSGKLTFDNNKTYYILPQSKRLDIHNLATGMKIFLILKTLIQKNLIMEGGVIIFDEPEVHLHPKWQIILAEFIVLLQKELKLHILINTHSPYFMNAIETYTKKHKTNDAKFYSMNSDEDEMYSSIQDVTSKVNEIYKKLAEPFQELENEDAAIAEE